MHELHDDMSCRLVSEQRMHDVQKCAVQSMHDDMSCWIVSDWQLHGHIHADVSAVHDKCAVHGGHVSHWSMPRHHEPNMPAMLCLHCQSVCVIQLHVELEHSLHELHDELSCRLVSEQRMHDVQKCAVQPMHDDMPCWIVFVWHMPRLLEPNM